MTKEELLKDGTFLKEVSGKKADDVQKAFAAKGVNISTEEAKDISEGKLPIDALDDVAGGRRRKF